jgi:hypothetical protein
MTIGAERPRHACRALVVLATVALTIGPAPPASARCPGGRTLPTPAFGAPEPSRTTCMTVQAVQRQVSPGQSFAIPIWMIRAAGVASINYEVEYDPRVLAVEATRGVTPGTFFRSALQAANTAPAGRIRVGRSRATGESGTGSLAYLRFRAVGVAGQSSSVRLKVTTIDNARGAHLPIDVIDGRVEIVAPQSRPPGGCPPNDGVATAADAICALQMSVGLRDLDQVMDIDHDASVTSHDATVILRAVASSLAAI